MRPANMMPMPIEIQRTRGVAVGLLPKRSQVATKMRPTTLRNDSMESTSPPSRSTIFDNTSETPSARPAAIPGKSGSRKCSDAAAVRAVADSSCGPESCPLMLFYSWRSPHRDRGSIMNERTGAELGEQFEQDGVRHLAVEDHHAFDAAFERIDAGLDFGDHATGNSAVGDQPPRVVDRQFFDQRLRFVE